jgi:hypothetical protein
MDELIAGSNCWPRGRHLLLLKAALAQPPVALAAWREFAAADGLEQMDEAGFRLLPRVHQHLAPLAADLPQAGKLRAVHRQAWCRNQIIFHQAAEAVRLLRAQGIPVMVQKGVSLSLAVYRDGGARPMRDADLLVRPADAPRAHDCLREAGWRPRDPLWNPGREAALRARHAVSMVAPSRGELDLHWHASYLARTRDADEGWWQRARPVMVAGEPCQAPSVEDELVLAVLHGVADNPIPAVRWVADACLCLQGPVDWDVVLAQVRAWRAGPWMRDGLSYLRTEFDAPVPDEVLRALDAPLSRARRAEYRYLVRPEERQSLPDIARRMCLLYGRGARDLPWPSRVAGFVPYLAVYWRADDAGALSRAFGTWLRHRWRMASAG